VRPQGKGRIEIENQPRQRKRSDQRASAGDWESVSLDRDVSLGELGLGGARARLFVSVYAGPNYAFPGSTGGSSSWLFFSRLGRDCSRPALAVPASALRLRFWLLLQAVYIGDLVSGPNPGRRRRGARSDNRRSRPCARSAGPFYRAGGTRLRRGGHHLRGLVHSARTRADSAWRLALTGLEIAVVLAVLFSAVLVVENARIGRSLESWRVSAKLRGSLSLSRLRGSGGGTAHRASPRRMLGGRSGGNRR